jgi:hypothetical protein
VPQLRHEPEIVYALMEDLVGHLQDKMIDNIPPEFAPLLTYIDVDGVKRVMAPWDVKMDRVYDPLDYDNDPETPAVIISVHTNDPADLGDGWKHEVASGIEGSSTNAALHIGGIREVGYGGATMWWRRLTVFFDCYYMDSDQIQDDAARLTNATRAVIERCCSVRTTTNVHGWSPCIVDAMRERSLRPEVVKSHYWEGGGPDTPETGDFIWRGIVWLQVLTARES